MVVGRLARVHVFVSQRPYFGFFCAVDARSRTCVCVCLCVCACVRVCVCVCKCLDMTTMAFTHYHAQRSCVSKGEMPEDA